MAVYTVNRRRAIILLILSSVLLLTLDLRGNPLIDRTRSAFANVLSPFETAGRVIANPIRDVWHGATDYDDLAKENERLLDQIAQQRGAELTARAIIGDYQELLAQDGLTSNYLTVTARVVGGAPGNFEQTVEIDRGAQDGLQVGMAVINQGGLVGKVTKVYDDRSVVRLVTDTDYTIECKVAAVNRAPGADGSSTDASSTDGTATAGTGIDGSTTTEATTPSGEKVSDLSTTTTSTTTTTTTTSPGSVTSTETTVPGQTTIPDQTTVPGQTTTTVPPTTTTVPLLVTRETGGCTGRGAGKLPAMEYVTENPVFGPIAVGDVITTTGGSTSLAPPDLIIGEVINKVSRAGTAGPLLEIKLGANLDQLYFVQVVLYRPTSEVPG